MTQTRRTPHGRARTWQVLEIEATSIDRGASIREFSQYPAEVSV
jgi:hypothetical protein